MNKISRFFGTSRVVSFPTGSPPVGTCEFATKICLKECHKRCPNFKHEYNTYKAFCEMEVDELVSMLETDVKECSNQVLTWFAESGDCPTKLTTKIATVMRRLSMPQNGFTRNKHLWGIAHYIPKVGLVLTEENEKRAIEYAKFGLVGIPNYDEHRVRILKGDDIWICGGGGVCGCGTVEYDGDESEEDCGLCYKMSRGCYAA